MSDLNENTLLLVIIAILLPPLAVGLKTGFGSSFIIGLLFYFPGLIYALYVVLK